MRAALYFGVTTANGQTTDKQGLEAIADRDRSQMVEIYEDAGISGEKGREKRSAFDCMLKAAVRRAHQALEPNAPRPLTGRETIEVHRAGQDTIVVAGRRFENPHRVGVHAPGASRRVSVSATRRAEQTSRAGRQ